MTEWLPYLSVVGIFITLLTAAAAAAGFYRATSAKATVEIQGQTIKALEQRLEQVLADNTAKTAENTRLTGENTILRDALGGKADIERLETLIENHHKAVIEDRALDRVAHEGRFDHVDKALLDIKGMLDDRRVA